MDDQSLWKKELSFGRKPEGQTDADESPVTDADAKPTSPFNKELTFKRADVADDNDAGARAPADEPEVEESDAAEPPVAEETLWKKEVSFSRKASHEDEVVEAEPDAVDATTDEVASEEPVWTKEVSFSRVREAEPVAEQSPDELPVANELPVAHEEPVAYEEAVPHEEPVEGDEEVPVAEPAAVASVEAEPAAEGWDAPPAMPPAPVAEALIPSVPLPMPSEVVHPPVAASDLPPLVDEDVPKVPFWTKEIGGKKRDKPAKEHKQEAAPDDVQPPVAAADLPPLVGEEAPKVPFWKKELALGGKKGDKPAKERKQKKAPPEDVEPPVAGADLPPLVDEDAPKVPFWKKDIGKKRDKPVKEHKQEALPDDVHPPVAEADLPPLVAEDATAKVPFWKKEIGGKKGDKPVKERKQKAPKVKAERAPKEPKEPKQPKERKQKTPKVKAERGNVKGRLIGLKIGASQLAAARVSNNGSAELLQVAREPLAAGIIVGGELRDPDALSEALSEFFAKHGLPKKGVRLGIANNRIGVRTFEIAGIEDQKQLANAIRFRAQETLPIPIDEAVLDYQVLGEGVDDDGQPTKRVLLVVAYRELIDRYVDACKKAGITLVGIDLEAFALLRALQAPQEGVGTDASAALVVVAIGHERSTFAVSDGRVCEFTRVLEWGGSALNVAIARAVDAAPSEVEATKRALSLMDEMVPDGITADQAKAAREAMRRAIQTFARELVSSLQYYQNQPGSLGIGEIVLTGGTAHLPGLSGELERLIGVHVRVGDPLARMKVSKKVGQPEQIGSLAVAIGLGIED
jgi:type IV pilus assembly protein PilM